jgi:hypothetical protein
MPSTAIAHITGTSGKSRRHADSAQALSKLTPGAKVWLESVRSGYPSTPASVTAIGKDGIKVCVYGCLKYQFSATDGAQKPVRKVVTYHLLLDRNNKIPEANPLDQLWDKILDLAKDLPLVRPAQVDAEFLRLAKWSLSQISKQSTSV